MPPLSLKGLLVAVDGGAREALRPLAGRYGGRLGAVDCGDAADESYWRRDFARDGRRLLIVGTSDSTRGRRIEAAARIAARAAGLPIAAIEDFPGNYSRVCRGDADLVVVESDAARALHTVRTLSPAPRIAIVSPARYDVYREKLQCLRAGAPAPQATGAGHRRTILWAGQPETDDALRTLEHVVPAARALHASILFKAHPRDEGYARGDYQDLLASDDVRDCTAMSTDEALASAPALVVTQFSSVAVEAGFYGIPALCVLLPDAGGARLREKKGYAVPPFCRAGAVASASSATDLPASLHACLLDAAFRARLIRVFDEYYAVGTPTTPLLIDRLSALLSTT